jgi:hypothetical protein
LAINLVSSNVSCLSFCCFLFCHYTACLSSIYERIRLL